MALNLSHKLCDKSTAKRIFYFALSELIYLYSRFLGRCPRLLYCAPLELDCVLHLANQNLFRCF